jgi:hypothetical protein
MLYFEKEYPKKQIVIHHTAGSHHPHWTIDGWKFKSNGVGAAYVIGGKSNSAAYEDKFDGVLVQYFDPKYWAYHLGIKELNHKISKQSVAIELCNYGPLIKNNKGNYLTKVNNTVPEDQVSKCKFRNYEFYESYSEKQIATLKDVIIRASDRFNIDPRKGLYERLTKDRKSAFEVTNSALSGDYGLWTHTNYRQDKSDCSPQDILINMILSL